MESTKVEIRRTGRIGARNCALLGRLAKTPPKITTDGSLWDALVRKAMSPLVRALGWLHLLSYYSPITPHPFGRLLVRLRRMDTRIPGNFGIGNSVWLSIDCIERRWKYGRSEFRFQWDFRI